MSACSANACVKSCETSTCQTASSILRLPKVHNKKKQSKRQQNQLSMSKDVVLTNKEDVRPSMLLWIPGVTPRPNSACQETRIGHQKTWQHIKLQTAWSTHPRPCEQRCPTRVSEKQSRKKKLKTSRVNSVNHMKSKSFKRTISLTAESRSPHRLAGDHRPMLGHDAPNAPRDFENRPGHSRLGEMKIQ